MMEMPYAEGTPMLASTSCSPVIAHSVAPVKNSTGLRLNPPPDAASSATAATASPSAIPEVIPHIYTTNTARFRVVVVFATTVRVVVAVGIPRNRRERAEAGKRGGGGGLTDAKEKESSTRVTSVHRISYLLQRSALTHTPSTHAIFTRAAGTPLRMTGTRRTMSSAEIGLPERIQLGRD